MNLFGMLEVSGSALGAERWRAEVVSANMANAETTRTPQGGAGFSCSTYDAVSSVVGRTARSSRRRSARRSSRRRSVAHAAAL